ncbi:GIY-YIG nuclease family protein [Caenimonas aquaedulcis]|uniref:GIY-YIG nuclease family protein n=1 Tax=Caenimonas aquaedulcis TaxID=2793270 RepID=A0A931H4X7_9BURK|nr:GIY-YIG nuclease family protein [Caenimonas aquaedulcis]MBG9388618.1 GIY-YIG nuclease family protein [Caenimonas aquaedulcis]
MANPAPSSPSARRELSRHYKDNPPPAGVFAIRNLDDHRVYVNGSMNVDGAMNRARFELTMRGHRNKALQADWLRLGAERFSFEIVDTVKKREEPGFDAAAELEGLLAMWRQELGSWAPAGYNEREGVSA